MKQVGARTKPRVAMAAATWFLIGGLSFALEQNEATASPESLEVLMAEGGRIYRVQCARCHGSNGEGQRFDHGAAPRLSGTHARLSVSTIAVQVIRGGAYMPPFGTLTDREIAAVATYIRNSFGNDLGIATEAEIAENR